jgi:diaminohydroxyphosphoribosylaminopyrimidine deaminase/5-amino-6-(5-phosphoribosylamino)uracil reductase
VAVGEEAPAARVAALASTGATVLQCKSRDGRVDVVDLCARLLGLDVMAVLLEGGSELNGAFLQARLVGRVAVFVAPTLLGGASAPGPAGGLGLPLPDAVRLGGLTARPIGDDWLLEGTVER